MLKGIYQWLSEAVGRSWANEFAGSRADSRSEPFIAFFGIGGVNRTLLLDCRSDGPKTEETPRPCRFAEPWQTTLQHTDAIWVVYIEDDSGPFDTTVDVEFKQRAVDVDYEAFDPRAGLAGTEAQNGPGGRRTVRLGFKRFMLREAPVAAQVAFTRQGPGYGLRQWQRVYRKFSSRYYGYAATVLVAPQNSAIRDVQLGRGTTPETRTIEASTIDTFLFGGVAFRLPGIRARSLDQPNQLQRFLWNLIPDFTAVTSLNKGVQIYGGSWPIWDRLHVSAGWRVSRNRVLKSEYVAGSQVGRDLGLDDISQIDSRVTTILGFSVDVYRSR